MQCNSYVPVYYHVGDVNAGANVFSWHPFDSNNCGEERGYNIAMPRNDMDHYVGYHNEVLKQMIQNHETIFRYQVQELHRLYRRQRELMDEARIQEMFTQHLLSRTSESIHSLSRAQPEASQTPSHATSWLHTDFSCNTQRPPSNFISESNYNDAKFQPTSCKGNSNFFIDLNEPLELESLPSTSSCYSETAHMEIDLNSTPVNCLSEEEIAREKSLKTETRIDLNAGIEDEPSSPQSCSVLKIKLEDTELVGHESKECSPPMEKSEYIQVVAPLLSEHGFIELDTIAAQTLVSISSSFRVQKYGSLCWLAQIVSSIGDDLEKDIVNAEQKYPNFSHVERRGEMGRLSAKGGRARGRKQFKDFQIGGAFERTRGRKACGKPRKSDEIKKSMSLILKQPDVTSSKRGVLQSWGRIRKREGGRRRRASGLASSLGMF